MVAHTVNCVVRGGRVEPLFDRRHEPRRCENDSLRRRCLLQKRDVRTTADDDEEVSCSSRRNISRSHSRNLSINPLQNLWHGSRSPGLVVMGDESYSRGHGFKSQRYILDGHDIFSH